MAQVALLPRRAPVTFGPKDTAGNFLSPIVLDATVSEALSMTNEVTDHPVEKGFDVTDHVRPKPDGLTVEGWISDTPLSGAATQSGTGPATVSPLSDNAFRRLRELRVGQIITVVCRRGTYDSMAIETINVPDGADTYSALHFTITLKEIRVVENKLTRIVVAKDKRAQGKVDKGEQTPSDASGEIKPSWLTNRVADATEIAGSL